MNDYCQVVRTFCLGLVLAAVTVAQDQPNEVRCTSATACRANAVPLFSSNGGNATVTNSIMGQSGNNINVAGALTAAGNVAGANLNSSGTVSGAAGKFTGNVSAANLNLNGLNGGTVTAGVGQIGSLFGSLININTSSGTAIFGTSGAGQGVTGRATLDADLVSAVFGNAAGATAHTVGVLGFTSSPHGAGVYGRDVSPSNIGINFGAPSAGVWGDTGVVGNIAVLATADDADGVFAFNNSILPTIFARNNSTATGADVLLTLGSSDCFIDTAANLTCGGTITGSSKNFRMDDPRDPANKYLLHASVESSEMMNIYTGNVITDGRGDAMVSLPEWFEVLNTDFRYQLTVVGQFAQAIVAHKIENHHFQIRTSTPNVEVSWHVTGVRQDPYAKAHPLTVEQDKSDKERGFYIDPTLYGAPAEKQLAYGLHPELVNHSNGNSAKP